MFKETKSKFVAISMVAVSFVIVLILGLTNGFYYFQSTSRSDQIIDYISKTQFNSPSNPDISIPSTDPNQPDINFDDQFGQGSNNEIRFFTVKLSSEEQYTYNLNFIENVTQEDASSYALTVFNSGEEKGYVGYYRFKYDKNTSTITFLYCGKELNNIKKFVTLSVIFATVGFVVCFVFLLIFSSRILRPIKETYEKQKQFISNASHELKTPLTVISTNNELLEMTHGENKYTKTISKQVKKMTAMTKSLTLLAKLNEKTEIEKTEFDLSDLIFQLIDSYEPLFAESNIKLINQIENKIVVFQNEEIISEILSICLDNALKYARSEAKIELIKEKSLITISLSNDGENVPQGDLSYMAERFYRDDSIRSKVSGNGIGLSIAKQLCEVSNIKFHIIGEENNFKIQFIFKA